MKQSQQHRSKSNKSRKESRPTIGVLIHSLITFHQFQWLGVADAAQANGANVICFDGEPLHSPHGFDAQGNVIYDFIDPAKIDGLVVWSSGIGVFINPEEMRDFCRRHHLPVVSAEQKLEGIPSVLMDDYKGMYAAVSHLIETHGYRRIAFISGAKHHMGAQERYRAYSEALDHHGLPLEPGLVSPLTDGWETQENQVAIGQWLAERRADLEAIVTVNDLFANYALTSLHAAGVRVPNDVALVSFDDDLQRAPLTPPLTTVRPPFYKMGWRATELLLAHLRGEAIPEQVVLPTELIVRRSCGCLSPTVVQAAAGPVGTITVPGEAETFATALAQQRPQLLAELEQALEPNHTGLAADWAAQLLDAWKADLDERRPGQFLATLDKLLSQAVVAVGSIEQWHLVLSVLRRQILPHLADPALVRRAEDLWQQARTLIGEVAQWTQTFQKVQAQQQADAFRRLGQALITTFDVAELMDVINRELPPLGVQRCYLALYENPQAPTQQARLVLAYDEQGRIELNAEDRLFSSFHLMPGQLWQPERPFSTMVQPLYFKEQQLGFVLFEANSREGWIYEALRGQLSSALQGALLVEREKRALAESLAAQMEAQKLATELGTVAEVSIATSTILETNQLLQTVVDLAKSSFNLYHAHIYLLDEAGDWLNLAAGAGKVGRQMIGQGWRIPLKQERSLVARAARTQQSVIINDVQSAPHFLPNPLLPETRAEMAVPMIVSNKVVGVLDLQADAVGRFSQEDAHIQTILAGQIAVALQNARLYEALRESKALYLSSLDALPQNIFGIDRSGKVVFSNKAHQTTMGMSLEELLGKTNHDLAPKELADKYTADDEWVMETGEILDVVESHRVRATKEMTYVQVVKAPLRDANGKIIGIQGIFWDVTKTKQTENALIKRASDLETIAQVSTAISNILEIDKLLQDVVDLTKNSFDLYHVHIYLLNEALDTLVLAAGAGDVGRQMVAQRWTIPLIREQSLVARAARTQQSVIINDVQSDSNFLPNPLLPETRAEMAVPLVVSNKVVGVIDLQADTVDRFVQEDAHIQTILAGQIAVALQNARLYVETLQRTVELETLSHVSQRLTAVLDPKQLIAEVVEQVGAAFNYYYTQIYLFDQARENLTLAGGTGEAGRILLERQHSLPKGRGLVGRAAEYNKIILVPNVRRSIGAEIITQTNVEVVFQRETDESIEAEWYAQYIAQHFDAIKSLLEQRSMYPEQGRKTVKLGYVFHVLGYFAEVIRRGAEAAARDLQIEVEWVAPTRQGEHLPLFEKMVQQKKDGLVVTPDQSSWVESIQQALMAGIPVVTSNRDLKASPALMHVGLDNFQAGVMLARELVALLKSAGRHEGKILAGTGINDRNAGFRHVLGNTNYTLIEIEGHREDEAFLGIYWEQAINHHPDLIAVAGVTALDLPILAQIKRRIRGSWLIAGFDLAQATLEAIQDGTAHVTIGQHPYLQGYLPILALVDHLYQGKSLQGWLAEGWLANPLLPETQAEVAVPITLGDKTLGVLDVQHNVVDSFKPESANLLRSVADQVAVALENARLFEQTQLTLAETENLYNLSQRLHEASTFQEVIAAVAEEGPVRFNQAELLLFERVAKSEARALFVAANWYNGQGRPPAGVGTHYSGADSGKLDILLQSEPLFFGDTEHDQRLDPSIQTMFKEHNVQALAVLPLQSGKRQLGVLLLKAETTLDFTERDIRSYISLVQQVSIAIENRHLLEQTRARVEQERLIRTITDKIHRGTSREAILQVTLAELGQVLSASKAVARLGTQNQLLDHGNDNASNQVEVN